MRACAVKVDDVVGVAGFATPGMRVDVLITGNPDNRGPSNSGPRVRTLLQNIEVLSAGTDIQRDAEGKPRQVQVVNLLVSPDQAELLSLAGNETKIQLALRNPLDTGLSRTPGADTAELFGANPPKPVLQKARARVAPPASSVYLVEVFNGAKRSEAKFVSHEGK
jgi:pilus assembly protein CpaB